MDYFDYKPYVPVAARRAAAAHEAAKLAKKGHRTSPVVVGGRKIATTFWGAAWCDNLERYSDYANRLPRGRTYVRNGSVIDLQIAPGVVSAIVSGSALYEIQVRVTAVPKPRWKAVCNDCGGAIDSVVELLQGRFSQGVMARLCHEQTGLFPSPSEITFTCSCPDWASMCKHVAAVLYGIGARLDQTPDLLFVLRKVDQQDLIARASTGLRQAGTRQQSGKVLDGTDLGEMFGIEIAEEVKPRAAAASRKRATAKVALPTAVTAQAPVRSESRRDAVGRRVKGGSVARRPGPARSPR
jgi:uncharacterized Zn finger protein